MAVASIVSLVASALAIRYYLINSSLAEWIATRKEISTPLNSWKRTIEGVTLHKAGISPYDGDIFHEAPLFLFLIEFLLKYVEIWIPYLFIICDLITAFTLSKVTSSTITFLLDKQEKEMNDYSSNAKSLLLKPSLYKGIPFIAAVIYLLHPYSIVSCVARSTTVVNNLMLSFALLTSLKGTLLSTFFIAFATYQSFYPVILIFPAALFIVQKKNKQKFNFFTLHTFTSLVTIICLFGTFLIGLLWLSAYWLGNWDFLKLTYGCVLSLPDLTPNIGIFWYFFIELFEHFRLLFLCVFQINVFIYVLPLTIRFMNDPPFLMLIFCCLMTIFKSYPCVGDIAFYMALLPAWSHLNNYMRQNFIVGCSLLTCTFLGPILWHLWIYAGSANANFYFAVTLVFGTAQIFFVTDILFAYLKRKYHLYNGVDSREINGKPAKIILK